MLQQLDDQSDKPEIKQKIYSYLDFIQFEPNHKTSGMGKMFLSNLKSQPIFSIGTSERKNFLKQFINNELARTNLTGKESLGPNYHVTDKYQFNKDPAIKIGTGLRRELSNTYDYYNRKDIDFNPADADNYRKQNIPNFKMNLENRFQQGQKLQRGVPGPQYNPQQNQIRKQSPKYSFGHRREIEGLSCIKPLISTPNMVGPGSYIIQTYPEISNIKIDPKYSFPKNTRKELRYEDYTLNQTYANQDSVGTQFESKKKSGPIISIGKAQRNSKQGYFPQSMAQQSTKISIPMPNY